VCFECSIERFLVEKGVPVQSGDQTGTPAHEQTGVIVHCVKLLHQTKASMIQRILSELDPGSEGAGEKAQPITSLFVDDDLAEHLDKDIQVLVQQQRLERVLFVRQI
jgi:hypothetical protein